MKLHLTSNCISIHVAESSSHYEHVRHVLEKTLGRPCWVNETLINFDTQYDSPKRKAFLTSLYYTCAFISKTHNTSFLQKLILASQKPIKLIKTKSKQRFQNIQITSKDPYLLLDAHEDESLESIRKKYLRLAKVLHPDCSVSNSQSQNNVLTAKFQQIQEAYAIIKAEKMKKIAA